MMHDTLASRPQMNSLSKGFVTVDPNQYQERSCTFFFLLVKWKGGPPSLFLLRYLSQLCLGNTETLYCMH